MTGALGSLITCAANAVNGETLKTGVSTTMLVPLPPTDMRISMLGQAREIRIVLKMRFGGLLVSGFRESVECDWD